MIELQDLCHVYTNIIKHMNINHLFWLGSIDCNLFKIFMNISNTIFIVNQNISHERFKLYSNDKIEYMYIEDTNHIKESIEYFKPIIFTPFLYKYTGYVSLAITPNLYCMMPGNLQLEYLPHIGNAYNFNASVVCIDKNIIYSIRSSNSKFTHSDLVLTDYMKQVTMPYENICREDVRLFTWKGELYGSYTFITPYIAGISTFQNLTVGRFKGLELVEEVAPKYGGNLDGKKEKNWTWWESPSGRLHCVYNFTPLKILEFTDLDKEPIDITIPCEIPDTVRGGACGVIYDDKVWCFTHTIVEGSGGFNVGLVVLSHSDKPMILGYCNNLVGNFKGIFFYICGAYFDIEGSSWKLTGGVQDSRACVITISHTEVISKVIWV